MDLNSLSLKEVERRAYRSTFEDGVYDIQFGLLFLVVALIPILVAAGISRYIGYTLFLIPVIFPLLAKHYITIPRMGRVVFGPKRQKRKRLKLVIGAIGLALTIPLIILTAYRKIPGAFGWEMVALLAAPILIIAAFLIDYPRYFIYLAILIFGVVESEVLLNLLGSPLNAIISFGPPGIVITGIGVNLMSKFMRTYKPGGTDNAEG